MAREKREQTKKALDKFILNPQIKGGNFEKVTHTQFHSLRVDLHYRIGVHKLSDTQYILMYVGPHDETYNYLNNTKVSADTDNTEWHYVEVAREPEERVPSRLLPQSSSEAERKTMLRKWNKKEILETGLFQDEKVVELLLEVEDDEQVIKLWEERKISDTDVDAFFNIKHRSPLEWVANPGPLTGYENLERRYRHLQATFGDIEAFVDRMNIRDANQVEEILKLQNLNEELNDQVTSLETELDTVRRSATEQESRPTADHLRTIDRLMKENREMKADINRWKSMAVRWSNLGTTKKFEAMVGELEAISDVLGWLKSRLGEFNVYFRSICSAK